MKRLLIFTLLLLMFPSWTLAEKEAPKYNRAQNLKNLIGKLSDEDRESVLSFLKKQRDLIDQKTMKIRQQVSTFKALSIPSDAIQKKEEQLNKTGKAFSKAADLIERNILTVEDRVITGEVAEAITMALSPTFLICKQTLINPEKSDFAKVFISTYFKNYKQTIDSIGAIEIANTFPIEVDNSVIIREGSFRPIGTGFIVSENFFLTNKHVAEEFVQKIENDKYQIMADIRVRINFSRYYKKCDAQPKYLKIEKAIYLHPTLDLALLQITSNGLPPLLFDADNKTQPLDFIAVVGYPDFPKLGEVKKEHLQPVFSGPSGGLEFSVKRFQPGIFGGQDSDKKRFRHYASTLAGNSGAPVIRLEDGLAVGIHSHGIKYEYNLGIFAHEIQSFLSDSRQGIKDQKR